MKALSEVVGGIASIVLVVAMWAIACMIGVIPFMVGIWLWNTVLG